MKKKKKKNFLCNSGFLTRIKMTNKDISKANLRFRLKLNACMLNTNVIITQVD